MSQSQLSLRDSVRGSDNRSDCDLWNPKKSLHEGTNQWSLEERENKLLNDGYGTLGNDNSAKQLDASFSVSQKQLEASFSVFLALGSTYINNSHQGGNQGS